ncbi:MAG: HAD family hydrolase [Thermoplasmata archaeon]|nr:HAD family hydrolase [Thermoplasmata archaeon]
MKRPRPVDRPSLEAVTSDVWYTLLYLRPRDQSRMERQRRRIWSAPLLSAGWSKERALAQVHRLEGKCHREEAGGRSFRVKEQAAWMHARCSVPFDPDSLGNALDDLLAHAPIRPAQGARAVILQWRDLGLKLGLVSNVIFETGAGSRALLERAGLLPLFDSIFLSSEHPWTKPDPRAFRFCLRQLDASPRRSVHVGDRPWDTRGAQAAGMRAIRFRRYRIHGDHPDWRVRPDSQANVIDVHSWRQVAAAVAGLRRPP